MFDVTKLLSSKEAIDGNRKFQKHKSPQIENGFMSITKNKAKWWRCTHRTKIGSTTIQCICIISNAKYEKLTADEKAQLSHHEHVYPRLQSFIQNLTNPVENEEDLNELNELTQSLCFFVAETDLSISAAVSQPMKDLLTTAIKWGQTNIDLRPEQFLDFSRNTFRNVFVKFANTLKTKQINFIQSFKIISVQIDAGKLGSKNYIECTISNFYSNAPPIHYRTHEFFEGRHNSYVTYIKEIHRELSGKYNLSIAGIVADNLRVQWSALKEVQNHCILSDQPAFLILPCSCHNLALALNDAISSNPVLTEACSAIIRFSVIFRKKISSLIIA